MKERLGHLWGLFRDSMPAGSWERTLYLVSIGLVPLYLGVFAVIGLVRQSPRALGTALVTLIYVGPFARFLFRRSQNQEAVFFTVRTHRDREDEYDRLLWDVFTLGMAAAMLMMPIYIVYFA